MEADPEIEMNLAGGVAEGIGEEEVLEDWGQFSKMRKSTVPKRGTKDFEPILKSNEHQDNESTYYDILQLTNSRHLMYDALSHPRGFGIKGSLIPTQTIFLKYDDNEDTVDPYMFEPKGKFLETIGTMSTDGKTLALTKEEALYLVERGSCICMLEEINYPLSLEDVYSLLFANDKTGDEYNKYLVYHNLKTFGYIVQRYKGPHSLQDDFPILKTTNGCITRASILLKSFFSSLLTKILPYRTYDSIFQYLNNLLMPLHGVSHYLGPSPKLKIAFDVWKPNTKFKKKSPPRPDFQVVITDSNKDYFPKYSELKSLLQESDIVPSSPAPPQLGIDIKKLKYGSKRIVTATIDNGILSFNQVSETSFKGLSTWREEFLDPRNLKRQRQRFNGKQKQEGTSSSGFISFLLGLNPFAYMG